MSRISSISSLYDFIGYVVLCAPDDFPKRDYLPESEQMNLDRAFEELRNGIDLVKRDFPSADENGSLTNALQEALSLYKAGSQVAAAHRLQDFQDAIFQANR